MATFSTVFGNLASGKGAETGGEGAWSIGGTKESSGAGSGSLGGNFGADRSFSAIFTAGAIAKSETAGSGTGAVMFAWQDGQGPEIPARLAGTLNCTPQAVQENVIRSVLMAGRDEPMGRVGGPGSAVNSGI